MRPPLQCRQCARRVPSVGAEFDDGAQHVFGLGQGGVFELRACLDVKDYCLLIYFDEIEGVKSDCNTLQIR